MHTLYQRLTGAVPANEREQLDKISIHVFKELLHDFNRGNISASNIVSALSLDTDQTAEATTLYQKSNLVANKEAYFVRVFGYLVLAESEVLPTIYNEINFWSWINGIS
jgi:hypothetical protein